MPQTPSQTVGPFFAYGLTPEQYDYDFKSLTDNQMIDGHSKDIITINGQVLDGEGTPIPDALIEIWQNDKNEKRFGRFGTGTDPGNRFVFKTVKPQPVNGCAPYLSIIVFMRGQLIHSYTRLYFSDEEELNQNDPVLRSVPDARRKTLIAKRNGNHYSFDIRMQGTDETVFFDI